MTPSPASRRFVSGDLEERPHQRPRNVWRQGSAGLVVSHQRPRTDLSGRPRTMSPDPFGFGPALVVSASSRTPMACGSLAERDDAGFGDSGRRARGLRWPHQSAWPGRRDCRSRIHVVEPLDRHPTIHPFLWENGRMIDIGTLGGTAALSGRAAFWAELDEQPGSGRRHLQPCRRVKRTHAFLWVHGTMQDLGTSEARLFGSRFAINDSAKLSAARRPSTMRLCEPFAGRTAT